LVFNVLFCKSYFQIIGAFIVENMVFGGITFGQTVFDGISFGLKGVVKRV